MTSALADVVDAPPGVTPAVRAAGPPHRPGPPTWVPLAAWSGLIVAAVVLGAGVRGDRTVHVGAAPFVGTWSPLLGWRLVPAVAVAVMAAVAAPGLAARLRWPVLLALSGAAGVAWSTALAWSGGAGSLTAPLATRYEYLAAVPRVGSVGEFVRTFVDAVPTFPTHVKSHPPGLVLVLWVLDRLGLGGAGWATGLVLLAGAAAVVAALVALRELAGEAAARRAAPFVALAPAAVFVATSSDAVFTGLAAWGVALVVLATGRHGAKAVLLAAGGGLLVGATLYTSYGLVLIVAVPAAVCLHRRRADVAGVAAGGVAVVAVAFTAAGFWWPDGLAAARTEYEAGLSSVRPYGYFVLANLAVFAVLVGPATAAALGRLRDGRAWLLAGAALLAVAVADLSGLSKGEVERIWLPFVPWVVVATCALAARASAGRTWLAAHLGTGLALQVLLRSPW